jgi:hypothetical protein
MRLRDAFVSHYNTREVLHWFPGHMAKGLKVMGK